MADKIAAVVGIGPGNGESITRMLASNGYRVAMLTRTEEKLRNLEEAIDGVKGFVCDAADADSVASAFAQVRDELGEVDVLIYNAGVGVWGGLDDVSSADFEHSWRVNCLGLFLTAKEVVPSMEKRGGGSIVVIGAGAAWRGRAGTIAFAQAKTAQRSTAQSLARQYGPAGIHVSYVVVDGVVDLPRTRRHMSSKPDAFFLDPDDIAFTVKHLIDQPRSAWTFEVDLRPHIEEW